MHIGMPTQIDTGMLATAEELITVQNRGPCKELSFRVLNGCGHGGGKIKNYGQPVTSIPPSCFIFLLQI